MQGTDLHAFSVVIELMTFNTSVVVYIHKREYQLDTAFPKGQNGMPFGTMLLSQTNYKIRLYLRYRAEETKLTWQKCYTDWDFGLPRTVLR